MNTKLALAQASQSKDHELMELEELLDALRADDGVFSSLIKRCYFQLGWTDERAALVLDTSVPNVRRWFQGKVVPPSAKLVLKFLQQEIEAQIKSIQSEGAPNETT